jgi:hypothetical protein
MEEQLAKNSSYLTEGEKLYLGRTVVISRKNNSPRTVVISRNEKNYLPVSRIELASGK